MSRVFESCLKSLPQGCDDCALADECAEKQLYEKGRADKYKEITSACMLLTEKQVEEIRADAIEDFERKMAFFCFGLKASEGNLARVDVFEDELARVKRQLKEQKDDSITAYKKTTKNATRSNSDYQ